MRNGRPIKAGACVLLTIGIFALAARCYAQSFSVTASPSSLTIYPGQQNVPITITTSSSTYTGPIVVTLSGLPSGMTIAPLTLTAGNSGTLKLNASLSAGQEGFPPSIPSVNTSWTAPVTVVAAAGDAQITSQLAITVSISNPSFAPAPSAIHLPIVTINTSGTPIVSKTTDIPGTITITSDDGQTSYLPNSSDADNTANFHVHGNSTANEPKLAYEFKLGTSLDLLETMGLSCPYITNGKGKTACDKSKTYVLLANYDDKTFLRDWSASALANAIPFGNGYLNSPSDSPSPSGTNTLMQWAPHSLFVELYLNGVYEGNYQLIEKVNVDSHRINITELSETDTAPSQVTGGYLMEIDHHEDEAYVFVTPQGVPIGLADPDFTPDPEVPEQTSYITSYVDAAEAALYSGNFTDPTLGWRAYFDEASAVNFYIVNDVMGNVDGGAFQSSDYLYKDVNNPLIYMGPVWDFDISSGNINYQPIVNPTVPWFMTNNTWYQQWFKDPGFKADVITQWNALESNGVFTAWLASISQQAVALQQSQTNNYQRWPMLGIEVWPNSEAAGSYNGEVAYMENWINLRIRYLDGIFNSKAQTSTTLGTPAGTLRNGKPVTLTAQVTGGTAPTGEVSFLFNGVLLGKGSLSAGVASLTTNKLPVATADLQAVYSGDDKNALSASTSQSITVATRLAGTVTSIAGPILMNGQSSSTSFSASVIPNTGVATPTGTLTFSINGSALGTATLSGNAIASFVTTQALMGGNLIQAVYSGDANYRSSTSEVVTVQSDFTLTASGSEIAYGQGKQSAVDFTLTPIFGFNQAISFTCSGLPSGAACSFSPSKVTPGNAPAATTLTVSMSASTAAENHAIPTWTRVGGGLVMALLFWPMRKQKARFFAAAVAALMAISFISGCGSGNITAAYPITISATGGAVSHTTTITLIQR